MHKKAHAQTEMQNFHTRMLYFEGSDVLY